MTDTAEAGSVVVIPPAGTPAQPNADAAKGSAASGDNPFSGLSEGTRNWVATKGYKSFEAIADSAMAMESKLGSSLSPPTADAPAEEWDKFYSRLPEPMRPVTSPDKLEFKLPEGLPEGLPYNEELAATAKQWAVDLKVPPGVAQGYHDKFVSYMAEQATAQQALIAQSVEATHDDLVKDWGAPESEAFKAELAIADRAMKGLGLVDAFKGKGILLPDGALTDPQIARAFNVVGKAMFKEDTIDAGGLNGGVNPFKKDANGDRNLTAISALVKSDPERAKRMAREAGENPAVWMPNNPL